MDIYEAWLSGGVNRWHQNSNPILRNSGDTNWRHEGSTAKLVYLLGGTAEEVVIALFHDAAEKVTGDKKGGTKTDADYAAEEKAAKAMGLHYEKTPLVELCDKLDTYLWARLHGSGTSVEWMMALERINGMAVALGLTSEIKAVTDERDVMRDGVST